MKKQVSLLLFTLLLVCGCTAPQYFWPQEDIGFQEINQPTLEQKILIASRKSEFKNEIIQRIQGVMSNRDVYIKIIGIESLKYEDANRYSAVVLLNTAMGWKADRKVESFLDKYGNLKRIIVLTTSDGGDVLAETKDRQIDAISTASTKAEIEDVSIDIIRKINKLIDS